MAQSFIDKYVFALMLDSSDFEKGANNATKAANGIKTTLLKTFTALGGINLFKNMLTSYTDAARNIDMLNILTGENTVQLQAWEKTIQDTGGNVNAFRGSLRGLNDSFAQFRNFGQADNKILALFRQGISPTDTQGNWKKGTEVLKEIAKVIRTIKSESSAWTWAQAMGIDEGTFRMMRIYGEKLDDIIKKNEKYAIINKKDIETTRKYDAMLSSFKTSWLDLSQTIMSNLLPVIQDELFPAIKDGMDYFRDNKTEILDTIKTICDLVLKTSGGIVAITAGFGEIAKKEEKNVKKHGLASGTLLTGAEIFKDAEKFYIPNVSDRAKFGIPLLGAASALSSYIINVNKMEVKTEDSEGLGKEIIEQSGKMTELQVNTGAGVQNI